MFSKRAEELLLLLISLLLYGLRRDRICWRFSFSCWVNMPCTWPLVGWFVLRLAGGFFSALGFDFDVERPRLALFFEVFLCLLSESF